MNLSLPTATNPRLTDRVLGITLWVGGTEIVETVVDKEQEYAEEVLQAPELFLIDIQYQMYPQPHLL